jgi:hypothetical protein
VAISSNLQTSYYVIVLFLITQKVVAVCCRIFEVYDINIYRKCISVAGIFVIAIRLFGLSFKHDFQAITVGGALTFLNYFVSSVFYGC